MIHFQSLRGVSPVIPITVVDVSESEDLVLEVLRSGSLAQGPMVARLEKDFSEAIGVEHCVAVNNGTTALVAALKVCDIQQGQEVITSPFTFVATLNAVLEAGGIVRFADINESDFCVNVDRIEDQINGNTSVIMPVHLYGQCADMTRIMEISNKYGLQVVEDAAQAHGAKMGGVSAGSFGIGCFSLYATKNLTSGEGGLITTNDGHVADRLRILRNQGMRERYKYEVIGHNYRMTDLHAAVAVPQISKMSQISAKRADNAQQLTTGLCSNPFLKLPQQLNERHHVWHQFTILISEESPIDRDEFIVRMSELGIGCGAYYPKLAFDYDCFKDDERVIVSEVPTARKIATQCVSLPVHQHLSRFDVDTIIDSVNKLLN